MMMSSMTNTIYSRTRQKCWLSDAKKNYGPGCYGFNFRAVFSIMQMRLCEDLRLYVKITWKKAIIICTV